MTATELRIGNLFNGDNVGSDNLMTITAKDILELSDDPQDDFYKEIPLTEDWLLKLGFIQYGIKFKLDNFSIVNFGHVFGFNYDDTGVNIKHVHQLQNLYFALTGEELTLK